jgi:hypothetical protein
MGTANFSRPSNASKYFVVLAGQEEKYIECPKCENKHYEWQHTLEELKECDLCEEDLQGEDIQEEYVQPEDFECQDLIDNLGYEIKNLGGTKENEYLGDRNYPIQSIGVFKESKMYGDLEVTVKITATIQSAYYEGATLDWLVEIEERETWKHSTGSSYDEDLDDIMDMIFDPYYTDFNAGLCKIMQPKAVDWAEQTISDIGEKLEKLYEDWSSHKLHCKGVFSNGEAIYETAN